MAPAPSPTPAPPPGRADLPVVKDFRKLKEPRRRQRRRHRRHEILVIAVGAIRAGAQDWQESATLGRPRKDWRRRFLPPPHGMPTVQGGDATREERHRLGDYFRAIRVEPAATGTPNVLRVVFERHTNAGRYWRDLMVRILHAVEGLGQDVKVEFASRVDEPSGAPPDRAFVE